jgi:hypothetical protein
MTTSDIPLFGEKKSWDGEDCGTHQDVVDPDKPNVGNVEEKQEDHSDKVVHLEKTEKSLGGKVKTDHALCVVGIGFFPLPPYIQANISTDIPTTKRKDLKREKGGSHISLCYSSWLGVMEESGEQCTVVFALIVTG